MKKCGNCKFFIRINFKDDYAQNGFYEASYFPVVPSSTHIINGVCTKKWVTCTAEDQTECNDYLFETPVSLPLKTALYQERKKYKDVNPRKNPQNNFDLYVYYIKVQRLASKMKLGKMCGFCAHWQENRATNIDIPPAYIPYNNSPDLCVINIGSKGKCLISGFNVRFTNNPCICQQSDCPVTCKHWCNSFDKLTTLYPVLSYYDRMNESKRRMRALMRLEAIYITHCFPNDYTRGEENKFHMRLFNSYSVSNDLHNENKFLRLYPGLFKGIICSSKKMVSDHVTKDKANLNYNINVINDFARYYHVSREYLLCYDTVGANTDIHAVDKLVFGINSLYRILSVIRSLISIVLTENSASEHFKDVLLAINSVKSLGNIDDYITKSKEITEYLDLFLKKVDYSLDRFAKNLMSYSLFFLSIAEKELIIDGLINGSSSKTNKVVDCLKKNTGNAALFSAHKVRFVLPSEALLVEIYSLLRFVPEEKLAAACCEVLQQMFKADERNESEYLITVDPDLFNTKQRILYKMDQMGIQKNTLCKRARINPKSYEAKIDSYEKNSLEPNQGFSIDELSRIAYALCCSIEFLVEGKPDWKLVERYGVTKPAMNPFSHPSENQLKEMIANEECENEYTEYIYRVVSNLFAYNPTFTTTAIEYYRRVQPKKVIQFLKDLQKGIPELKNNINTETIFKKYK